MQWTVKDCYELHAACCLRISPVASYYSSRTILAAFHRRRRLFPRLRRTVTRAGDVARLALRLAPSYRLLRAAIAVLSGVYLKMRGIFQPVPPTEPVLAHYGDYASPPRGQPLRAARPYSHARHIYGKPCFVQRHARRQRVIESRVRAAAATAVRAPVESGLMCGRAPGARHLRLYPRAPQVTHRAVVVPGNGGIDVTLGVAGRGLHASFRGLRIVPGGYPDRAPATALTSPRLCRRGLCRRAMRAAPVDFGNLFVCARQWSLNPLLVACRRGTPGLPICIACR